MLQSIFAMTVLFPLRRRTENAGAGPREVAWPERRVSPRECDIATSLAARALCGIDRPLVL